MAKKKIRLADLIVRLNDDNSIAGFEKKTKKAGKAVDIKENKRPPLGP